MNEKNVNNKKKSSANVLKTENGRHFGMNRRFTRDDCGQAVIDGHVILPLKESGLWKLGSFAVESASSGPGSWKAD